MIYMEPVSLGWMPILVSWLNTLPPSFTDHLKNHLHEMYSRFCPCLLQLVRVCKVREREGDDVSILRSFIVVTVYFRFFFRR